ncbi:MAG: polysaccharide biosynthesis tyrosine autokinase [Bacteroidales bacterium]|nr:polysaccharide biosynthesis tyrosine autokinase [Bacteroidales bacterium]
MTDYIDEEKNDVEESSGIDFRLIWSIIVLNWYWFIISAVICVGIGYLYLRYQHPAYQASTKVLIKDESNTGSKGAQGMDLEQLGIINNTNGFDNELEIISSAAVATRAVKALKLYVAYSIDGRMSTSEMYKTSPILVDLEESRLELLNTTVPIDFEKLGKDKVRVHISLPSKGDSPDVLTRDLSSFPCVVHTKVGKIMFSRNPGYDLPERTFHAVIYPPVLMGRTYARRLHAEPTSKMTTVAVLSIVDTSFERAQDYLAQLVKSYNEDANEDKNEVAQKTEEFIAERIEVIQGELGETEGRIEGFKRSNELTNLPTDATAALSQSTEFQKKQVEIQTQMSLVKSLLDYVQNPTNSLTLIPANIGMSNESANAMIRDYNTKVLNRNRLIRGSSESSPAVVQVTDEAQALWEAVGQQLRAIYRDLEVQKNSIDNQYALFAGKVSNTPTQERAMNDMGRQQQIKASLYLMLLERREENYISLISTANKARIIDEPQYDGQVSPKSRLILMASLILGLLLPLIIFYLRELLRFRIEGRDDLEKATKIPVVADIPLTDKLLDGERAIVVKENKNNMMEEAFRNLRTNLRFLLGSDEKVICCTSSVPSEGKTFVATNLAMSLALLGKKVIVIGLDIRKPRLVKLFGLPKNKHGITSYLAADKADFDLLEEQIVKGVMNPNLDVLPAGIIPPNPGELITRDLLDRAIDYLKTKYDYILLDTPPVGLVSDTFELARLVDVTFFIVRSEVTTKGDVEMINRLVKEGKLPKTNIVFNGINLKKKRYGLYYGYGKYSGYKKYGTYYGRYGHYGSYGHYGDSSSSGAHIEK